MLRKKLYWRQDEEMAEKVLKSFRNVAAIFEILLVEYIKEYL